jgi:hypothetical protein
MTKGMVNMKYPNPIYKTKKVLTYIADLIIDYDYDHYFDLSEHDKAQLASLLSESAGSQSEHDFIFESDNLDKTISYFRKALCGTAIDDENFLEVIKKNAIDYYDRSMEELFNYVWDHYRSERNEWSDAVAKNGNPDEAYDQLKDNLL